MKKVSAYLSKFYINIIPIIGGNLFTICILVVFFLILNAGLVLFIGSLLKNNYLGFLSILSSYTILGYLLYLSFHTSNNTSEN